MLKATEEKLYANKKLNISDILENILEGHDDVVYLATEEQIASLISSGKISDEYLVKHLDCKEELDIMLHTF